MKKFFLLAVLILTVGLIAGCGSNKTLRLGTGGEGGMYFAYGNLLADHVKNAQAGYLIEVKTTAGSAANLRLIRDGFLDFAIVQSDIFAAHNDNSAAVAAMYYEPCQIIVRADSDINSVEDLTGKRVSVGEEESGALKNATEILLAHGLTVGMIRPEHLSFADAANALENKQIDAAFITAGTPTKAIAELANKMPIRFLSVELDVINNMMKVYHGYTKCTIPANTYHGQTDSVETIGVKAVLVTSANADKDDVEFMTKLMFDGKLDMNFAVEGIDGGFHPGAVDYYEANGIKVKAHKGISSKKVMAGQD